jgi:hypothetical protein
MATVGDGAPSGSEADSWLHARLIPTYGIRSQDEQEKRATSCLLAVMHGVPEFGHALLRELGAPKSPSIDTFAEVRFKNTDGKVDIPDGAIVCQRGAKRWTCLVEVKTGSATLKDEQVGKYLDIARDHDFDGVLTISNQITHSASESPVVVDGRKLRKTNLWHFSWWRILTEAVVQSRYRGVSDADQAWVLRELIHYLSGEASGVAGFDDMGKDWVPVRTAAHDGTLRGGDPRARQVAERWDQFTEYLCLSLSQELGRNVVSVRPRKQGTSARLDELEKALAADGDLQATIRVPDAISDLQIRADLKSRQTSLSVDIAAPSEGRPKPRINWLLRQLSETWADLRIEVWYPHARETVAATLEQARERPEILLFSADPTREPRSFVLTLSRPMGQKRGRVEGSFVRETREQAVMFYRDLVQNLKAWQVRPPQIRTEAAVADGSDPPSPPDLLPLTPADHMLPAPADSDAPDDDAADGLVSESLPASPFQGSIQGSVLSEADPAEPDATPTITGDPTAPDLPWETS